MINDQELFSSMDFAPASMEAWAKEWGRRIRRGLFRDADDLLVSRGEAAKSFEPQRHKILAGAERVLRHDIQGWGDVSIRHGAEVDFDADYGRSGKYGFHYWVWARPLIQAFLLTEDQKYLAEFDVLFTGWYEQRDRVRGEIENLDVINYELGLGLRNRTFLEYYYLPFAHRPVRTHERMLKTLLHAGRWLFAEEERGYRQGNWQIMGCAGLATIAALMSEFRESAAWLELAAKRLVEHLERDVYSDGCHWERVPSSYMLTVYKDMRNVALLAGREDLEKSLDRMLRWYMQTLPPDGVLPGINDGSRLPIPGKLLEEGKKKFPHEGKESICLPDSGFTILRSNGTRDALYMLINHGPMGGGHTHHDALSFQMHAYGTTMAIDSGIGRTYDDPLHEPWYITPAAHNMLEVVGAKLDRAAAVGTNVVFQNRPAVDYFAATHQGYEKSAGVIHRRHVIFVRRRYFLIVDEIQSSSPAELAWHVHSPLKMRPTEDGFSCASTPGLTVLRDDQSWIPYQSKGMASVAGISNYSDYAEIDWLQFKHHFSGGSATFAVLLYPSPNQSQAIKFHRIGPRHWRIDQPEGSDQVLLPDGGDPMISTTKE